jgi:hypothetical protein
MPCNCILNSFQKFHNIAQRSHDRGRISPICITPVLCQKKPETKFRAFSYILLAFTLIKSEQSSTRVVIDVQYLVFCYFYPDIYAFSICGMENIDARRQLQNIDFRL